MPHLLGNPIRLGLLTLLLLLISSFFIFDLHLYLTLEALHDRVEELQQLYRQQPLSFISLYMGIYIAITALSLPGAVVMTLAGGAILGLGAGTVVVSFASTIGATLAFLTARFLLREMVETRFQRSLDTINRGVEREGGFYLFTLRLIPLFPFFMINLVMGITSIRALKFFVISQIGMLPGTIIFVNAGAQLSTIEALDDILSLPLILSFALLGLFPLIAKKGLDRYRQRQIYRRYSRPKRFDYNLIVIGGGSAGLVSAYIAAAVKAKVALIERDKMGGDCLNTGCVPSKALIRSAKMAAYARRATDYGFKATTLEFDFSAVMERVQRIVAKVAPHDSVERYTALGVECIQGEASIRSPWEVGVNGQILTTRAMIIATGAKPFVPPLPGLEQVRYLTSETVWGLRQRPERMAILGGGAIGCELAQSFQRLGVAVTLVQRGPRLLPREDREISQRIEERFVAEGVLVLTEHSAERVEVEGGEKRLVCLHRGNEVKVSFNEILIALGRRASSSGLGLEHMGVKLNPAGTVATDPFLRTNYPNILVCGDVAGPYQFTHTAAHQAWYAAVNALFSPLKLFRVDYRVIPRVTYTDPEVARVGFNEEEAKEKQIPYEVTRYNLADLDRAITDEEAEGVVKVLTVPGKDKILGVTIVAAHAGDLLAEFVLAMKQNLGLNTILGTIHSYPTMAEANKYVAGNWRKAHQPKKLLRWVERYHHWRRRG
ncbi:MAG: FAD-dependent oxidoreductase [Gammaproteobacteria bacterium]|nr:FAD-dependent oxidoreductase [Gammaproteobacteria bacterium]